MKTTAIYAAYSFQYGISRHIYSKQILHADELHYFVEGSDAVVLDVDGLRDGLGICYEALQRRHFITTKEKGQDLYISSVAKSLTGIEKANAYFPALAKEFATPILMANCLGACDNFESAGQSAVWNSQGDRLGQLDHHSVGLLVYDTDDHRCDTIPMHTTR